MKLPFSQTQNHINIPEKKAKIQNERDNKILISFFSVFLIPETKNHKVL